jgi:hypothetical protein
VRPTFRSVLRTSARDPDLPLAVLLSPRQIEQACDDEGVFLICPHDDPGRFGMARMASRPARRPRSFDGRPGPLTARRWPGRALIRRLAVLDDSEDPPCPLGRERGARPPVSRGGEASGPS